MFFILSKTVSLLLLPSNLLVLIGLAGLLLLATRFRRIGRRLAFASLMLLLIAGLFPIGARSLASSGKPLSALGSSARRARRHRRPRRCDRAGIVAASTARRW